ncbi:nose resistant to fluoxetine protein 6-like [Clytia hemisphaerica]|uniref:Nose resistant-to-fluoxetine protein N-terminal domain-containing protein n=1 Tax=Clytia hemisphaerica TaxID=252671 RepID=A0A7M5X4Z1_9CNID
MSYSGFLFTLFLVIATAPVGVTDIPEPFVPFFIEVMNIISEISKRLLTNTTTIEPCVAAIMEMGATKDLGQYIDATGKPGSGLYRGNVFMLGNFDECINISSNAHYCMMNNVEIKPYLFAEEKSRNKKFHPAKVGLCLPKECSVPNITFMLQVVADTLNESYFRVKNTDNDGVCFSAYGKETGIEIPMLVLFCIPFGIAILATIYDLINDFYVKNLAEQPGSEEEIKIIPRSQLQEIILSFSIVENTKLLFKTQDDVIPTRDGNSEVDQVTNGNNMVHCIHGIRSMSMFWVIFGQFLMNADPYVYNSATMREWRERISMQIAFNSTLAVLTFFLISGFVVAYTNTKKLQQERDQQIRNNARKKEKRRKKNDDPQEENHLQREHEPFTQTISFWFFYFFHRFVRLVPLYGFIILFIGYIWPELSRGPLWYSPQPRDCQLYGWTNLVFANNIHEKWIKSECIDIGWYLTLDFQFHVIFAFFTLLLGRYWFKFRRYTGYVVPLCCVVIILGVNMYLFAENLNLSPFYVMVQDNDDSKSVKNWDYFSKSLYKPWSLIAVPYCIGLALGQYITKNDQKRRQYYLSTLKIVVGWVVSISLALFFLFIPHSNFKSTGWEHPFLVAYAFFFPLAWSAAISWTIFACHMGIGGFFNIVLSWNFFQPISRLTYGAFFGHYLYMNYYFQTLRRPLYLSGSTVAFMFLGLVVISYFVGYLFAIVYEFPFARLEKLLMSDQWREYIFREKISGLLQRREAEEEEHDNNQPGPSSRRRR